MTLILNYEEFESYLADARTNYTGNNGYYKFLFHNGYGALVFKQPGSIGYEQDLWQVNVLEYNERRECWVASPLNPFTLSGIIVGRNCSDEKVRKILKEIKEYPKR